MTEDLHDLEALLADPRQIQGNILQPFDGRHQAFLFLSFASNRTGARAWLAGAADRVDCTADVLEARDGTHIPSGRSLMSVSLTATGLTMLHPEVASDLVPFEAFWKGPLGNRLDDKGQITSTPALLGDIGDSDPTRWVVGGVRRPPVDAMLTMAADDEETLLSRALDEQALAGEAGLSVMPIAAHGADGPRAQVGNVVRNADEKPIEHFGFVEGISNPGVRGVDGAAAGTPDVAAGEFVLGLVGERRPQTLGQRPTPAAWMRGGSFQVFRRLRQDVAGWWDKMEKLSDETTSPEEIAARAVGRRLDGTPLATPGSGDNDFTYADDPDGERTPLYAHIRKMNPRRDEMFRERSHKLLRRGIPYGPPMDRRVPDTAERGMLFNAYMASIEDQFEFLQRCWANDPEFPSSTIAKFDLEPGAAEGRVDGMDPVIGYSAEAAHRRHGESVKGVPPLAFGGFVTTTGSVYAFVPSRAALRLLAANQSLDP
ncbi:Dyp-type peroxidase [Paractinoplanes brasiliensis]|uniref:Dyp-type peroxidase family n=1 Tax=Paractinoplanes brasiliensis TaxID=52695 RepID=A0A4R6JM48_9ACTN|nr:Dyp-type peroxidase [Actinoplanes brasiliensis]TDO37414.1 Dyp-type peroxidase family [Actinoplanes brasiliensis]GID29270.1 peroxidase [Actinoplanes brasiliensis]